MLLATLVVSAVLAPQAPAQEPLPPMPEAPATQEVAPVPEEPAPPPISVEPAPTMEAEPAMPVESTPMPSVAQEHIDAGLKAFIRGRFSQARAEFQQAYDADPTSAAAAFYLGYACYKLGEPTRRMDSEKQRAKELFAKAYSLDPAFVPVWNTRSE
jgi:TolA-binding protein